MATSDVPRGGVYPPSGTAVFLGGGRPDHPEGGGEPDYAFWRPRYPTRATSVRSALFLLLGVCVGGFVGMEVLGCGKQVLGVRAAKTTIERV